MQRPRSIPARSPAVLAPMLLAALASGAQDDERAGLAAAFSAAGLDVDPERGLCAFDATVGVRNEPLEYLLVAPHGAAHESLFLTEADPQLLNAALLALGAEPGRNASWTPKDPPPEEEALRAGVNPYDVVLPQGDGFYLYATWREGGETYFHRVEDLVRDLSRGRTMLRHRWVFLGSRMVARRGGQSEVFAASMEGNLINIAFFSAGHTLLTAALEECVHQTHWLPNAWLLPAYGSPVLFLVSRERLDTLPEDLAARVPELQPAGSQAPGGDR